MNLFLCCCCGNKGKWGFVCVDQNDNANADLPIKYQPKKDGGVSKSWPTYKKFFQRRQRDFVIFVVLMVIKHYNNYTSGSTRFISDIEQINASTLQSKKMILSRNILRNINGISSIRPLSLMRCLMLEMNLRKICLYLI